MNAFSLSAHAMKVLVKALSVIALALTTLTSYATQFSNVYVFGDSLSDNGNLHSFDPGSTYGERFTNGPVAVEYVAGALGFSLTPSYHLAGGTTGNNFAIAGAVAIDADGDENTPDINLPTQVNAFLQINGGVAPSDALYIVLIGGNDIRAARTIRANGILAGENKAARQAAREYIRSAVESEQTQIEKLIAAGARHILVANTPDIGAIPETDLVALQYGAQATNKKQARQAARLPKMATNLTVKYNNILARKIARTSKNTGIEIITFDLFANLEQQIDNAEDYGYTNTDDACAYMLSQAGALHPECDGYATATGFLFFDEIHPTAVTHQVAGQALIETLMGQ